MLVRLWAALSGLDGSDKRALPIGEFLHPVSIACVVVLALNDHVLKGSGLLPGAVTGKLSDVAGLAFFPLLLTAAVDLLLLGPARLGLRIDFSLRRWKLAVAIALTAVVFTLIKLDAAAAERVAGWLSHFGWHSTIVADPTDLVALAALAVPAWIGLSEISRVPLGRLEVARRLGWSDVESLSEHLADIPSAHREALIEAIVTLEGTGVGADLDNTLQRIRFPSKQASAKGID